MTNDNLNFDGNLFTFTYTTSAKEVQKVTVYKNPNLEQVVVSSLDMLTRNYKKVTQELLEDGFDEKTINLAFNEVKNSLYKRVSAPPGSDLREYLKKLKDDTICRSDAQLNASREKLNGLKEFFRTGNEILGAIVLKKEVKKKGEYKTVKSSAKTLCKNKFRKSLPIGKLRRYKTSEIKELETIS